MTGFGVGRAIGWSVLLTLCGCATMSPNTSRPDSRQKVVDTAARSDENARLLVDVEASFDPESASRDGVDGYDERVMDLSPRLAERKLRAHLGVEAIFAERLAREREPAVRTDLELLLQASRLRRDRIELDEKQVVPFVDVASVAFTGVSALLDERTSESRRRAALTRLRRYAGLVDGQRSIAELAIDRMRERIDRPGVLFPYRRHLERVLATTPVMVDEIGKLLAKSAVGEYEEPLARWTEQVAAYTRFVRETLLPRARDDFRQPPELYRLALRESGIDAEPRELARKARAAFEQTKDEMQRLAPRVARAKGLSATDYRDVIRQLKEHQLEGDVLLATYHQRVRELDAILRREHLVAVPARAMTIRLATAAENAQVSAPRYNPPPLVGNTGQRGELVLPAPRTGDPAKRLDDFTYEAASWWLAAHEGRPGHDLQYSTMTEKRTTLARAVFAFNSANAEGWGLYAEDLVRPYMPLDAQLVCLQARLMRAAHAFLDIELNLGLTTPEEARRVLREDVAFSEAWASQSVERYTFWWPAQAPSYFFGYTQLVELRDDVRAAMGPRFDLARFHDFVLAQGLVPPGLLRKAVFTEWVRTPRT